MGLIGYLGTDPSYPIELDVQGDFAYLGNAAGALQVIDVSNPCVPIAASNTWLQPEGEELWGLDVDGNLAFLANDFNGLQLYDISNPFNPVHLGTHKHGTYANSVFYDGVRYAYASYHYTEGAEFVIYDMTAFPGPPVGTYDAAGSRHVYNIDVDVARGRAYLRPKNGEDWFEIVDVSNPALPARVSTLNLALAFGDIGDISVRGDYAYIATGVNHPGEVGGLLIIDISDEVAPFVAGFAALPDAGFTDWNGPGLDVVGDRAYVGAASGLYVVDISDPTNPTVVDSFSYPSEFLPSKGGWVVVRDNLAYVTSFPDSSAGNHRGGLAIYKLYDRVIDIDIDIKPGSDINPVSLKSKGVIPVAILTTNTFDATMVDSLSVQFGPEGATEAHGRGHRKDVNGDGKKDLVLHFRTQDTGIVCGDTSASLTGGTFSRQAIEGSDSIRTVGCK